MRIFLTTALILTSACTLPPADGAQKHTSENSALKLNQIQILGTHNSYSLGIDPQIAAFLDPLVGEGMDTMLETLSDEQLAEFREYHPHFDKLSFSEGLNYAYPEGLAAQLDAGLRSLEIDVFRDPEGGRFLKPAGHEILKARGIPDSSLAPHDKSGLDEPGFKVLHMADIDFRSSCNLLTLCLSQLVAWSDTNPEHTPVFILLEAKDAGFPGIPGATEVLPFDAASFDALDAEIISVIGRHRIITPDDVRGGYTTLEQAVLAHNWPAFTDSRGKFVFLLLTAIDTNGLSGYFEGRPNLEGRVAFLRSQPGNPYAAFLLLDNALVRKEEIQERVRQGYLVRARSDIETYEAKVNDHSLSDAAFASGAQVISTDFYKSGNTYGTDYVVKLPADGDMRCNPVNASCAD